VVRATLSRYVLNHEAALFKDAAQSFIGFGTVDSVNDPLDLGESHSPRIEADPARNRIGAPFSISDSRVGLSSRRISSSE